MGGATARIEIPVRNIYYLLCYAWRRLEERDAVDVDELESTDLVNLFARVLRRGLDHLVRRGLAREYVPHEEATGRLRGRIDFARTTRGMLLQRAQAWCVYDELTHDIALNRILKATARRLVGLDGIDSQLREALHAHVERLHDVGDAQLSSQDFDRVRLHRNTASYGLLLSVCRFLHEHLLPEAGSSARPFSDFLRDEKQMHRLFEEFVREFYRAEQTSYTVGADSFGWFGLTGDLASRSMIPGLRTDIVLRSDERVIVIDTKYYQRALVENFKKEIVRPSHLNQLFAYVANITRREERPASEVQGILLYPAVAAKIDVDVELHGHRMRMQTVDLGAEWTEIHGRLLELVA
jgi:5-methylcytosine-specific restriction enzyme subunit McrC